jgi:hypothetical protein
VSWEAARGPDRSWMAEPVIDPDLDEDDRSQLLSLGDLLWTAGDERPSRNYKTQADSARGIDDQVKVIGFLSVPALAFLTIGLILQSEAAKSAGLNAFGFHAIADIVFFIAGIPLMCMIVLACALVRARRAEVPYNRALDLVAELQEFYILPAVDLDDVSKALFRRAKAAEAAIGEARASSSSLGEAIAHRDVPRQLWDLAVDLVALTNQAAAVTEESERESATPATMAEQANILAEMRVSLEGRVALIEAHADRVAALDRSSRDLGSAGARSSATGPAAQDQTTEQPRIRITDQGHHPKMGVAMDSQAVNP